MRVTNNMITGNTKFNINSNKVLVDKYNTQMTTQKKINKPSEDPVIAIRSLQMQTNLGHLTQYLDNNIKDANSWIDVTETALTNMKDIITRIRTQCVNGSTDTLEAKDRDTILKELRALQDQVYTEGNADYAGRTVFTGYRTNCMFTFKENEPETIYDIKENFTYEDLKEQRYYYGKTDIPTDAKTPCDTVVGRQAYDRLRLAYDKIDGLDGETPKAVIIDVSKEEAEAADNNISQVVTDKNSVPTPLPGETKYYFDGKVFYKVTRAEAADITIKQADGTTKTEPVTVFATEQDWIDARTSTDADGKTVVAELGKDEIVLIKDKGELVFGENIAQTLSQQKAAIEVNYTKTGFDKNEPRPEYYFDCKMHTNDMKPNDWVEYTKQEQKISYVISNGITLDANTQADEVLSTDIGRDVSEMIDIVANAINANEKVAKLEQMKQQEQYADKESQEVLDSYLKAAEEEAAYANDHLQKTYSQYISNFDHYLEEIDNGITNIGTLQKRLDMTQNRVENQKTNMELLKSSNEDREISDIIIDYYAAYNAYTASLTAASKVGQQTLLNYL